MAQGAQSVLPVTKRGRLGGVQFIFAAFVQTVHQGAPVVAYPENLSPDNQAIGERMATYVGTAQAPGVVTGAEVADADFKDERGLVAKGFGRRLIHLPHEKFLSDLARPPKPAVAHGRWLRNITREQVAGGQRLRQCLR